ncbi:hypothetical protein [Parapedobacter tibetensis]|uniref:hypothetical protein n=1 Tax=Parapedobacter tibetensis TaxID=2972951 RepID=UPI00214DB47A|nr:hypothetical protein [Parapedobacter tibetensis]
MKLNRFCRTLFFGLLAFAVINLSGCSKDDSPAPEPPPLSLDELYQHALTDAMVADDTEVIDTLWAITPTNQSLTWKTINGKQYVLMGTFMRYPASYPVGDSITNTWGESWLFVPQQMKSRIGNSLSPTSDTTMRICQLLGLPPANENSNTHIAEIWIDPDRLYRPAGNIDITTTSTGAVLANNARPTYMDWFNSYIIFAYYRTLSSATEFHYPWTRLGYTYDWAPETSEVGLSEYVLQAESGAWVEHVAKVGEFF